MKRNFKKGFTIVELVIVIAVIAILAAVLIPTFSNIVKKARASSDQQAVRQMNTVLMTESVMAPLNIYEVFDVLAQNGLSAKNYKALSDGMSFYWDSEINRVLYVDNQTGKAVYPEEYKDRTNNGFWQSLTQSMEEVKPDSPIVDKAVTVDTANELVYALNNYRNDNSVETIKLSENIDMMGAAFAGGSINKDLTIEGTGTTPTVIKNVTAAKASQVYAEGGAGHNGIYNAGLFATVKGTLTLKNIVIDNVNIKDEGAGNIAFLVGRLEGTLILDNVTIRNSSIIGHRNTGALVGLTANTSNKIQIKGKVVLDNVSVQTVAGRSGKLIGLANGTGIEKHPQASADAGIYMNNVTLSVYNCGLNTGVYEGTTLGLNNGIIKAKKPESNGGFEISNYYYFADTTIGNYNETNSTTYNGNGDVVTASTLKVDFATIQALIKPWTALNN